MSKDANQTAELTPWNEGRTRVTISGHDIEVFHVYGIPPNMGRPSVRARYKDQIDPVPMASKFTALLRRLERKFL